MTIRQAVSVGSFLTGIFLGAETVLGVHYLKNYQLEELEFLVEADYGEMTETEVSGERRFRLRNEPSQTPSGAQISIDDIQGDAYLFFDWFVTQADADPENYSFIRIFNSTDAEVYFEKNFHNGSMEEDRNSIRAYLKPGSTYTVKIGLHSAEPSSDAYSLTIDNLKICRYQSLELNLYSRNDPLFDRLIVPPSVDPETGNDPDNNNGANPNGYGSGYDTGDPITRGSSGNGNTGSGPDFNTGDPPTRDSGTNGSDFTDNAPNDPENNGFGTDEPIIPIVEPSSPEIIFTDPNSPPGSDQGIAPVLIRSDDFPFTDPLPNSPEITRQVPTLNIVPDTSLGLFPIATLIGLLLAKALMPSNPNRRRDQ